MASAKERPLGIWIFALFNILFVMPWGVLSVWSNFFQDEVTPDNPPYILAVAIASFVSTVGAWIGNRFSRMAMLVLLTLAQLFLIFVAITLVAGQLSVPPANRPSPSLVWQYFSLIGFIVALGAIWLAANYWYFLGARTRRFYSPRESV